VTRLSGGDVELALGDVHLEFHVDDGDHAADDAKRYYTGQFQAADTDNNGYLEKSELKDHGPLVPLFDLLDRDGDGKLYLKEVEDFVAQQAEAARNRMVLSASDQGRAIFSILDLNRDRRLGVREIRGSVARVNAWDRDGNHKVGSDEIPHHYQLTIGRARLAGPGMAAPAAARMGARDGRCLGRRSPLVPEDGPQPRRRRLPPRVLRPERCVRAVRPRPRRADRCRRGREVDIEEMTAIESASRPRWTRTFGITVDGPLSAWGVRKRAHMGSCAQPNHEPLQGCVYAEFSKDLGLDPGRRPGGCPRPRRSGGTLQGPWNRRSRALQTQGPTRSRKRRRVPPGNSRSIGEAPRGTRSSPTRIGPSG